MLGAMQEVHPTAAGFAQGKPATMVELIENAEREIATVLDQVAGSAYAIRNGVLGPQPPRNGPAQRGDASEPMGFAPRQSAVLSLIHAKTMEIRDVLQEITAATGL